MALTKTERRSMASVAFSQLLEILDVRSITADDVRTPYSHLEVDKMTDDQLVEHCRVRYDNYNRVVIKKMYSDLECISPTCETCGHWTGTQCDGKLEVVNNGTTETEGSVPNGND